MSTQRTPPPRLRLGSDREEIGRGLGQLVIAVLDIVRQLLERQALRRVDRGELDAAQTERLGQALQALDEVFAELRDTFDAVPEDGTGLLPADIDQLLDRQRADRREDRLP